MNKNIFQQYREDEGLSLYKLSLLLGISPQGADYLCKKDPSKIGRTPLEIVVKAEELGIPVVDTYKQSLTINENLPME